MLHSRDDDYYSNWHIPKRDGGERTIQSPTQELRVVQREILRHILDVLPVSPYAHGYVMGRNIATNASHHTHSRSMITADIQDAFGTTSFAATCHRCKPWEGVSTSAELGISDEMLQVVIEFVDYVDPDTNSRWLPQGAPTSPAAFNYAMREVDRRLGQLATNVSGAYSRYADNLAFSMPSRAIDPKIVRAFLRDIREPGFIVNPQKTHITYDGNRPEKPLRLPGVNIIEGDIVLPPSTVRLLRSKLYHAGQCGNYEVRHGIEGYALHIYGELPSQLRGIFKKGALHASLCP